jgi:hypothetical protein
MPDLNLAKTADAAPRRALDAWARHADALVPWTEARLVNRRDGWGAYRHDGATYTAKAEARATLADALAAHFRRGRTMGLHAAGADDLSRWLAYDVDRHDDSPADVTPARTLASARALADAMRSAGLEPLLEDSNGAGGFHVWAFLDAPVATAQAFHLLQQLATAADLPVETFPKQATVHGRWGNWLRVPGRHPKRDHWSRLSRDGVRWATHDEAARLLLAHPTSPAAAIPPAPEPMRPTWTAPTGPLADATERRIAAYVARVERRAAGQNRNVVGYRLAAWLVRDMALSPERALPHLRAWNAGNAPPYPDAKLEQLLAEAQRGAQRPVGCGLMSATVDEGLVLPSRRKRAPVFP